MSSNNPFSTPTSVLSLDHPSAGHRVDSFSSAELSLEYLMGGNTNNGQGPFLPASAHHSSTSTASVSEEEPVAPSPPAPSASNAAPRFVCTNCDPPRAFSRRHDLTRHTQLRHTNERPYACPRPGCHLKTNRKDQVRRHLAKHPVCIAYVRDNQLDPNVMAALERVYQTASWWVLFDSECSEAAAASSSATPSAGKATTTAIPYPHSYPPPTVSSEASLSVSPSMSSVSMLSATGHPAASLGLDANGMLTMDPMSMVSLDPTSATSSATNGAILTPYFASVSPGMSPTPLHGSVVGAAGMSPLAPGQQQQHLGMVSPMMFASLPGMSASPTLDAHGMYASHHQQQRGMSASSVSIQGTSPLMHHQHQIQIQQQQHQHQTSLFAPIAVEPAFYPLSLDLAPVVGMDSAAASAFPSLATSFHALPRSSQPTTTTYGDAGPAGDTTVPGPPLPDFGEPEDDNMELSRTLERMSLTRPENSDPAPTIVEPMPTKPQLNPTLERLLASHPLPAGSSIGKETLERLIESTSAVSANGSGSTIGKETLERLIEASSSRAV